MDSSESIIHIGPSTYNAIDLKIVGHPCPESTNADDKNWLTAEIMLRTGGFSGEYRADLRTEDFPPVFDELIQLHESPESTADFKTIEGQLHLTFTRDRRGHIKVIGTARDEPCFGNVLEFHFEIDQTFIPEIMRAVREVITKYPVIRK